MDTKKWSQRDSISESERLQIVGLLTLASQHNKALADIERAARAILKETELRDGEVRLVEGWGGGWIGEAVYQTEGVASVDDLLRKLGLPVEG
ncbi:MAG TPA: hypothetical protein VM915_17305 [Verrucomicrobiae bacterium]|jgi:hypothetical protein|nr:hypothetical protein [Verrucomicrobiae bacterium]